MRIIVFTGPLASGKSTASNHLASSLYIDIYQKDKIKEKLADEIGFSNREENRKLSILAVNMIIEEVRNHAFNNKDVIIDANFRNEELLEIKKIADKSNSQMIIFLFKGDNKVLYERFLARVPNRHRAHLSIGLDKSYEKFVEYNSQFQVLDSVFNPFIIDTTINDKEKVHALLLKSLQGE